MSDIPSAFGGRGMVSEAVDLHHEMAAEYDVDPMPGEDHLLAKGDTPRTQPHDEERLDPGIGEPARGGREFAGGVIRPANRAQGLEVERLHPDRRVPDRESILAFEAQGEVCECVLDGCCQRARSAIHQGSCPMQDSVVTMLVRVRTDLQVES